MTKKRRILNTIALIRNSHPKMQHIYTHGSCLNFHMILRSIYPEAEPYYNVDHVITKIDNSFYDITGVVSSKGYLPFSQYYSNSKTSRAFKQMYSYEPIF